MITIPIEGNIEIDIEKYNKLFTLIYCVGNVEIATILKSAATDLQKRKCCLVVEDDKELSLLFDLSEAFEELEATPILVLEPTT